jgi:hypothetical protein
MQLLLNKSNPNCQNIRQVTKEEFFNTKKPQKRMKTSLCFSEPIEPHDHQDLDSSLFSVPNEHNNSSNKDLDSTFA